MPYFSGYWLTHYKKLRNCCMTEPIEYYLGPINEGVFNNEFAGYRMKQLLDLDWMRNKKLKWIAQDKHGYASAWVDAQGMIHNIKDIPKSDIGKEYEKVTKHKLKGGVIYNPVTDMEFMRARWDIITEQQRFCELCSDHTSGSIEDDVPEVAAANNAVAPDYTAYINGTALPIIDGTAIPSAPVVDGISYGDMFVDSIPNTPRVNIPVINVPGAPPVDGIPPSVPVVPPRTRVGGGPIIDVFAPPAVPPKNPPKHTPSRPVPQIPKAPKRKGSYHGFFAPPPPPDPCPDGMLTAEDLMDLFNEFKGNLPNPQKPDGEITRKINKEYADKAILLIWDEIGLNRIINKDMLELAVNNWSTDKASLWESIKRELYGGSVKPFVITYGIANVANMKKSLLYFLDGVGSLVHETIHNRQKALNMISHAEREVMANYFRLFPKQFFEWCAEHYPGINPICIDFTLPDDFYYAGSKTPRNLTFITEFLNFYKQLTQRQQLKYVKFYNDVKRKLSNVYGISPNFPFVPFPRQTPWPPQ